MPQIHKLVLFALVLACSALHAQDFSKLKITEIMYNAPDNGATLGSEYDFIEIKNTGTSIINLEGVRFVEGIYHTFQAGSSVGPGKFIILCSNKFEFMFKYPNVTPDGTYIGKLSGSGDKLTLVDPDSVVITSVNYNDKAPWPAVADGFGFSMVTNNPNPTGDQGDPAGWRASTNKGGSPGADDPIPDPAIGKIIINEVLSHTEKPLTDQMELYNAGNVAVDISGWHLSDGSKSPLKFKIPPGTVMKPGDFISFDESDFNTGTLTSFSFNRSGEGAYIFATNSTGELTGYSHGIEFGPAETNISFGKYINSVGDIHYPAMSERTFPGKNAYPKVGPVVIDKIMYNVTGSLDEFVAIKNITDQPIRMYDPQYPNNTWRINGVGFNFPVNLEIKPYEIIFVTNVPITDFRIRYDVPASVRVFGPYTGVLQNSGEILELQWPALPDTDDLGLPFVPYVTMDAVRYNDKAPWPAGADGNGKYLQRKIEYEYGNDPINWTEMENKQVLETPDISLSAILEPQTCFNTIQPKVKLTNSGSDTLRSVNISYTFEEKTYHSHFSPVLIAPGQSSEFSLKTANVTKGTFSLVVYGHRPNGGIDSNSNNDTIKTTLQCDVGIANSSYPGSVQVFPNPARESVIVESMFPNDQDLNVILFDLTGRQLIDGKGHGSLVMDLRHLSPGTYFLQISGKGYSHCQKIIKR